MSGRVLEVGFVIDGLLPRWPRVWQWVRGCPSNSAVGEMRFGWIAEALRADAAPVRYSLYRPWKSYDAVIFLKSMNVESQRLAESLRARGTRIFFDVNVDYFTPAEGTFYYRGMAPTEEQTAHAQRMAALSDALIADSSHLAKICTQHHPRAQWISDDVDMRLARYAPWKREGKLNLLWSGESVKLFELLRIETVLRKYAPHIRLMLVTNDLAALDRWFDPWKKRFQDLLGAVEHEAIPFRSVRSLMNFYAGVGGIFISPRFLDNSYNWGHTEWKITLPMACGRVALGSPLPSYRDVSERSGGLGLRVCESDDDWCAALESVLSGRFDFETEENAARAVVEKYYSTPVVAAAHAKFVTEVCGAN